MQFARVHHMELLTEFAHMRLGTTNIELPKEFRAAPFHLSTLPNHRYATTDLTCGNARIFRIPTLVRRWVVMLGLQEICFHFRFVIMR